MYSISSIDVKGNLSLLKWIHSIIKFYYQTSMSKYRNADDKTTIPSETIKSNFQRWHQKFSLKLVVEKLNKLTYVPTKQIKFNQNLMQQCSQFPLQRAMMSDKTPRSFQNVHQLAAWEYTALFKVETFVAKHHTQTKIKKKTMQTPNLS